MPSRKGRPEPKYEERYCAFADILGFSTLIDRLSMGSTNFEALRDLLGFIHNPPQAQYVRAFADSDLRAQSISDAVCISTACNGSGLAHLFHVLEELSVKLLLDGFFLRGAIVKGSLYHNERMVFGEALVKAYRLESEIVRFPRIMVTSTVRDDWVGYLKDTRIAEELTDYIAQDRDGPYFLDVLSEMTAILSSGHEEPGIPTMEEYKASYNVIAQKIQRRLEESFDNPRHFEKVQWFARYWNRVARPLGLHLITGPGVDPQPAISE